MTPNEFRAKAARSARPLVGCWITIDSVETAGLIARGAFDFVYIDMEHTALSIGSVQALAPVFAARGVFPIVRVPAAERSVICRLLDCGICGIVVPNVSRAAEVRDVLSWTRYPPAGTRGFGPWRASDYFTRTADYLKEMRDGPVLVLQIETAAAIDAVRDIMGETRVDYLCTGPNDLAASLGRIGQVTDAEVLARLAQLGAFCGETGMRLASGTAVDVRATDCAHTLVPVTSDVEILLGGTARILEERCGMEAERTGTY